jgi:hypothetical protein
MTLSISRRGWGARLLLVAVVASAAGVLHGLMAPPAVPESQTPLSAVAADAAPLQTVARPGALSPVHVGHLLRDARRHRRPRRRAAVAPARVPVAAPTPAPAPVNAPVVTAPPPAPAPAPAPTRAPASGQGFDSSGSGPVFDTSG